MVLFAQAHPGGPHFNEESGNLKQLIVQWPLKAPVSGLLAGGSTGSSRHRLAARALGLIEDGHGKVKLEVVEP